MKRWQEQWQKTASLPPPTVIKGLPPVVIGVILELLSSSYAKGIQDGFTMSDKIFKDDPTATVTAYSAGIQQGRKEIGEQ